MQQIPNKSGSNGGSDSPDQNRSANQNFRDKESERYKKIALANRQVKLVHILDQYGIKINRLNPNDNWGQNITCPFPSHKNGSERSASFGLNFVEDRFHCFGCQLSGRAVEFIAFKDGVDKLIVAEKILLEFGGYNENEEIEENKEEDIEPILFELSLFFQSLYIKNKSNKKAIETIDKLVWWVDNYIENKAPKHKVSVESFRIRANKVQELLSKFK